MTKEAKRPYVGTRRYTFLRIPVSPKIKMAEGDHVIVPIGINRHRIITSTTEGFRVEEVNPLENFKDRNAPNIHISRRDLPESQPESTEIEQSVGPKPQTINILSEKSEREEFRFGIPGVVQLFKSKK